ncbi:phage holin family protein [Brevibacillus laterosporus]|uniref:phage holin family protein n=1 Tax=Brevibacillus laterosporus TaxID=1465 RepID=UPI001443C224|nr:phage holin family protein [Brevibacillus laterosporus]NKQ20704.1 hypothetical protein [Brevibacillus laterosporus]WNX29687.1 hypothetical protein RWW94_15800 [Brevibacillus laterosporus]
MIHNSHISSILDQVLDNPKRNKKVNFEENLEELYKITRSIHFKAYQELIDERANDRDLYQAREKINEVIDYLNKTKVIMENKEKPGATFDSSEHILSQIDHKDGCGVGKVAGVASVIPLDEIKVAWTSLIEFNSYKAVFIFLGVIINGLIGEMNILTWAFFVFTIFHFIMRIVANRYCDKDDYVTGVRNIGMFMWSYVLLAMANILGSFISINGLPAGTFRAFVIMTLVWYEFKGCMQMAKMANLYVPPIFEKLISENKKHDINSPF